MVNQTKLALVRYWGIGYFKYFSSFEKVYFLASFRVWFPELHMVVLLARLQDVIDVSFHSCWSSSEQPTSQCLTFSHCTPHFRCSAGTSARGTRARGTHTLIFFCVDFAQQSCLAQKCVFLSLCAFSICVYERNECDMATSALSKQHVIWPWSVWVFSVWNVVTYPDQKYVPAKASWRQCLSAIEYNHPLKSKAAVWKQTLQVLGWQENNIGTNDLPLGRMPRMSMCCHLLPWWKSGLPWHECLAENCPFAKQMSGHGAEHFHVVWKNASKRFIFFMKVSFSFHACLAERGTLAFSWRQWTHRMWCWLACFQCTSQTFEEGGARSTTEARRHMRCRSGTRRKGKINSSRWWGQSRCCRWYRQSGWLVVPCEHLEFRPLHSSCPESRFFALALQQPWLTEMGVIPSSLRAKISKDEHRFQAIFTWGRVRLLSICVAQLWRCRVVTVWMLAFAGFFLLNIHEICWKFKQRVSVTCSYFSALWSWPVLDALLQLFCGFEQLYFHHFPIYSYLGSRSFMDIN